MWEQLQEIIFDASQASGLESDFLSNLVTETYGVMLGIAISVGFALWLDHGREVDRRREQRRRAVTRWIDLHEQMIDDIDRACSSRRAEVDQETLEGERARIVQTAMMDAQKVFDDYKDAFSKTKMEEAFEDYRASLAELKSEAGHSSTWEEGVSKAAQKSINALEALIQAVGQKRQLTRRAGTFETIRQRAA